VLGEVGLRLVLADRLGLGRWQGIGNVDGSLPRLAYESLQLGDLGLVVFDLAQQLLLHNIYFYEFIK
jgi:hypothetical protein